VTPNERVQRAVERHATTWQKRLGLGHWEIRHVFLDTFDDDQNADDYKTTAITECRWQYLQAKIKWFLPSAARHDDLELEKVLVHELVHVLLAPEQSLVDTAIDHSTASHPYTTADHEALSARNYELLELSTELVTRALWNAWQR